MAPADTDPETPSSASLPWELMFNASPLPTSLSRARDGCMLAVNDAWLVVMGLTRAQVIGRTTVELGHWPSEDARQRYLAGLRLGPGHEMLCLDADRPHRVRLQSTLLEVAPEPLLLVVLSEITSEHETEMALQQVNLELQQQVELHGAVEKLARAGHWTNALNDQEVIWSQGLYDIAGVASRPTLQRSEGRGGIHPDDLPAWHAAREARDGRVVEFRWQCPNGEQRWMRTRISQTAVAGNPQTDFGVVQDITAEKEAGQALAGQLEFIQNITARVPGVLFLARVRPDGSSSFLYMSQAAVDMLELDAQDLKRDGNLFFARVHPGDKKALVMSLQQAGRERTFWRGVYRVLLPSRGLRWYSVEALPQWDADGSTLWHGFTTDVTESRLAAQALERQHRMLDAVRKAQLAFIEADDKRQAFEALLAALLLVTHSEYGFVGEVLYDAHGQPYLKTHAITNIAWDERTRRMHDEQVDTGLEFRNTRTLFGHALLTGETVISNDPRSDPRAGGRPSGHPGMSAFLGVPLAVGDQLVAMIGLANQPGGYSEADVEFLQPLLGAVRQLVLAWRGHAERQRAREQFQATSALLAEKSAALQVTFDSMSQGLTMVDADGRVRFYNRRMLELLDLPEALLASQPRISDLAAFQAERGDFGSDFQLLDRALRPFVGLEPRLMPPETYLRRTRQGAVLEICSRALPGGGMVRTYTDVTSYVQAEEALRDERQRLQWVLEATRPGIWETNVETGAMEINDRWAEMLGYTVAELQPTTFDTWRRLVHPQDLERAERVLHRHWGDEQPYYECDLRMRHKDGHWVWINDRGRVHRRGASGEVLYMSGTHLDINERVAAQEQVRALNASLERRVAERTDELERSMKDMEAISYSIAHDLRAPLRSVNGFAALVAEMDGDRLSPEGRQMFERITHSSRNMGQMISDMLELLRVVRVEIDAVPVDMNALARSVTEALAPAVPHAQIQALSLPAVLGDAALLRQVLVNLVDNALKYSRHRAEPLLELGFDAGRSAFYLRDNGMGFNMAHANKLFGLFQRLHTGADAPVGTGVGLAIVARSLERHGGRIWAESIPGQGATFWWTLPLA
ncbi:MAG: PAS domain-containing protein [Hydrogenophaga sp.]|uniref:PAS domain-containing protein n=1 Tax=Hydrogenophaga sp. TaxID=1904254 RepID=UPI0025C723A7|nr:PAS domain-containing protein [Hydrogenophaga sp.]MBT9551649.1 PAS domain-containing protein [Hydrogenophaga sp.]